LGGQGGSTITQQVIKNALLTKDKTLTRKIKEWILAPRLEQTMSKDRILEIYLNEIPFGGSVYGIEEASRRFFSKAAKDLNLAEAAYLAALPQAPTYYSPYGANVQRLESRKNQVLGEMKKVGFITEEEYQKAKDEKVIFSKQENYGIKAPHFVMYILDKLEKEYGKDVVQEGGLKVITTLDWELQNQAEEVVKKFALENKKVYNAENSNSEKQVILCWN
jgi:membrane peptidoglycan carboxypeptidase